MVQKYINTIQIWHFLPQKTAVCLWVSGGWVNEIMHKQVLCPIWVTLKLFPNTSITLELNCGFKTSITTEGSLWVHAWTPYEYPDSHQSFSSWLQHPMVIPAWVSDFNDSCKAVIFKFHQSFYIYKLTIYATSSSTSIQRVICVTSFHYTWV